MGVTGILIGIIALLMLFIILQMNDSKTKNNIINSYREKDKNNKWKTENLEKIRDSHHKEFADIQKENIKLQELYLNSIGFKKRGNDFTDGYSTISIKDKKIIIRGAKIPQYEQTLDDFEDFEMMIHYNLSYRKDLSGIRI